MALGFCVERIHNAKETTRLELNPMKKAFRTLLLNRGMRERRVDRTLAQASRVRQSSERQELANLVPATLELNDVSTRAQRFRAK
jgi:hypothetical protein